MTTTPATVTGVTILAAKRPFVAARVRECGNTFAYEKHTDLRETAILMACLCPHGHGVASLPWRGWVRVSDARMDLIQIPTPAPRQRRAWEPAAGVDPNADLYEIEAAADEPVEAVVAALPLAAPVPTGADLAAVA